MFASISRTAPQLFSALFTALLLAGLFVPACGRAQNAADPASPAPPPNPVAPAPPLNPVDSPAAPPLSVAPVAATESAGALPGQPNLLFAAQEEALRRQETAIVLKQTLLQAQQVQKQRDLPTAAKLYEEVLGLSKKIGGAGVEKEHVEAMAGLANVRLLQALEEQERGEFDKAADFAQKVLDVDPQNKQALEFKKFNLVVEAANKSR